MLDLPDTRFSVLHEDEDRTLDFSSLISYAVGLLKRHFFLFMLPFLIVILVGTSTVKLMSKTYRAEGEILVESQKMPTDLFRPSINELFDERFALFRQLIMAPDNLLAVMNKFKLFADQRASLSQYQLLDLMRSRVQIEPATLEMRPNNQMSTFAFTVKFDYEVPDIAVRVTNEFLTQILSADATRRAGAASETTKLVEQQVKQARDQRDAIVAQIEKLKRLPPDQAQIVSDEVKARTKALADLQADLIQKSSVYSEEHPTIKDLKRKIAALKRTVELTRHLRPRPRAISPPMSARRCSSSRKLRRKSVCRMPRTNFPSRASARQWKETSKRIICVLSRIPSCRKIQLNQTS